MSQQPKSIFTSEPTAAASASSFSTRNPSIRPSSGLVRNFSEAARDLPFEGGPPPHSISSSARLRARALYGHSFRGQIEQEHAISQDPLPPREPEFKTPASPAPRQPVETLTQETSPTSLKRSAQSARGSRHSSPNKRIRLDRSRHTADEVTLNTNLPQSPLFFSHHHHQPRPVLPARFSSSEAAAKMLSKAQGEETSVKTVQLARGKPGSPQTGRSVHSSRYSTDRWSTPRSTQSPTTESFSEQLGQIGVLEFLEHDERPTFIVDVTDPSHPTPAGLHPLFANVALKSHHALLAAVSGPTEGTRSPLLETSASFQSFRSWVFSISPNFETPERVPMKCIYAGYSWSGSMLRKRLRVICGTASTEPAHDASTRGPVVGITRSPLITPSQYPTAGMTSVTTGSEDLTNQQPPSVDYFGMVASGPQSGSIIVEGSGSPRVVSSIEEPSGNDDTNPNVQAIADGQSQAGILDEYRRLQLDQGYALEALLAAASASDLDQFHSGEKEMGFFDWTRIPASENLPQHIQFTRSIDWGATPLGPIHTWSPDLRQMCNLIMASPHPAAMYWGSDLVAIYNEAYILLAGQKHPSLMGQRYQDAWSEIWDEVKDVFASAQQTGQATMKDDDRLFIKRNDFLEETYFSWSIIPMVGADGTVNGLYNPAFEKTRRKIAERRMLTLREVGERTAAARDVKGFWDEVLTALEYNEYDTPFVLLYSLSDELESEGSSIYSNSAAASRQCFLEGGLGVRPGHACAPEAADFASSNEGFLPYFREVVKTNKPRLFDIDSGELDASLLEGLDWRGFGDPAKAVVVCPIHPTTDDSTLGFLVLGVNPRRPYDEDYNLFVQLLSRQLATSLASVVLFEAEIRRGQRAAKAAALDRLVLSEQLAARTQEAVESETKFTRMAENAPVGIFIANDTGRITYCNDTWYHITRVPKDDETTRRWADYVSEEDKELVESLWHQLVNEKTSVDGEFKFKAPWTDRNGVLGETWVLFSAFPDTDDRGNLKSVFGCLTNISEQKWAEGIQKRKMEEAVELKRQQENFIDTTSHEMRNPLSAILQCSDEIVQTLTSARAHDHEGTNGFDSHLLDETIDAAQTIALCAQHQKRIVDDVLTMSKLDSALLMVTPFDAQPLTVAQRALKMFENETQTADIDLSFVVDASFKALGVDWVRFDPSRVLQVLINLTTNAIKFTTTESRRKIVVSLAAYSKRPSEDENSKVKFIDARPKSMAEGVGSSPDWGTGDLLFIQFAVEDTGRGLTEEERTLLFRRFSQASPRTHVQYGGSGLGLFISKELTELQGGQIGVASEAGKGSTFAFYVMARRSTAPEGVTEIDIAALGRKPSAARIVERVKTRSKDSSKPHVGRSAAQGEVGGTAHFKPSREAIKVLIVEDNVVNQRVLKKQLTNVGCETVEANHGGEALQKLQESWFWSESGKGAHRFHVVLMDQEMPVMDGLTCTKRIRSLEKEGKFKIHVPIIAVTANARKEQIKTILDAGMDDVVSKPFRMHDLMPKIEEMMEKYSTASLQGN